MTLRFTVLLANSNTTRSFIPGISYWRVYQSLEGPELNVELWWQNMLQHTVYPLGDSFASSSVTATCRVTENYGWSTEDEGSLWHTSECTSRSDELSGPLPSQSPWLPDITEALKWLHSKTKDFSYVIYFPNDLIMRRVEVLFKKG